ncbi:MAG: Bax inhibitor-1 family protein [Verrucomicrobiae bacterium]|nr:Bax inhibitor-1 family protein [Verrucomicrobiae bacterium]NNJ42739.1 permease [Akkermansiaceae bacterium]
MNNPYASTTASYANPYTVAAQPIEARTAFIRATYGHLAGAIAAFALLETLLMSIPGIGDTVLGLLATSRFSWLLVLGGFMFISHFANQWAMSSTSKNTQYLGLGIYVVAEALIFLPLLLLAQMMAGDNTLIMKAGGVTMLLFLGLTIIAFTTKKDFSFLGGMLKIVGMIALGVIVIAVIFPGDLTLGLWFSVAMVIFAAGTILYNTSNIIHHYNTDQYVAASLGLFASVALLFWYVLRIFMSRD